MKKGIFTALALGCAVFGIGSAKGQQTNVTATALKMNGAPVNGLISLTAVDTNGNPIVFVDGSGSQDAGNFVGAVVNGMITGAVQADGSINGSYLVPDSTLTNPANILYKAQICDTSTATQKCYTIQNIVGLGGTTFPIDHYSPFALTTSAQPIQYSQGNYLPQTCVAPNLYTNTASQTLYECIAGVYVAVGGSGTTTSIPTANASSINPGSVQLATGQSSPILSKVASTGAYSDLSGLPTLITSFSGLGGVASLAQLPTIPYTKLSGTPSLGAAATHGISTTINGVPCSLDSTCTLPTSSENVQANGSTVSGTTVNFVAGSGITITTGANGVITISTTSGGTTTSSALPTPPSNAYVYSNLQQESTSCPTAQNSASQAQGTADCWQADTIDATAKAGAGIAATTLVNFSNSSPSLSSGGSMQLGVQQTPIASTTMTGTSGALNMTVASTSGIHPNSFVCQITACAGVPSNERIEPPCASGVASSSTCWDGSSSPIPLTLALTANLTSETGYFSFNSNALFARHLPVTLQPTMPAAVTNGTTTVNPGTATINATNSTLTITGASATDTASSIVAMQVYVDNVLYFSDASTNGTGPAGQSGSPYTPLTYTTGALAAGSHQIGIKAFNSASPQNSVLVSFTINVGGANLANVSNLLDDLYYYIPADSNWEAIEFDPDIFANNYQLLASTQCIIDTGSAQTGQWRFWNMATSAWVLQPGQTYPCTNATTTGVFHHYQLYATFNQANETYTYQTLVVDGATVFQNIGLTYSGSVTGYGTGVNFINAQTQIDMQKSASRTSQNSYYIDQYSLTAW